LPGPEEELTLPDAPARSFPHRLSHPTRADQLCALLASEPGASLEHLSRELDLSRSTTLRILRPLLREKRVVKRGFARATRYQLAE
jgi:predicted transcriptional regulator